MAIELGGRYMGQMPGNAGISGGKMSPRPDVVTSLEPSGKPQRNRLRSRIAIPRKAAETCCSRFPRSICGSGKTQVRGESQLYWIALRRLSCSASLFLAYQVCKNGRPRKAQPHRLHPFLRTKIRYRDTLIANRQSLCAQSGCMQNSAAGCASNVPAVAP
jgi:hypothetical protein